jgi:hypothetical protein
VNRVLFHFRRLFLRGANSYPESSPFDSAGNHPEWAQSLNCSFAQGISAKREILTDSLPGPDEKDIFHELKFSAFSAIILRDELFSFSDFSGAEE